MSIAAVNVRPAAIITTKPARPADAPSERPVLELRSTQDDKKKILFVTS